MSIDPRVLDNAGQGMLIVPFNIEAKNGVCVLTEQDIGAPIALTANDEISEGESGEVFCGKLLGLSDDGTVGYIQVKGICTDLAYRGEAPVIGWAVQMSDNGSVCKGVTDGIRRGFTLNVDAQAKTCDILL